VTKRLGPTKEISREGQGRATLVGPPSTDQVKPSATEGYRDLGLSIYCEVRVEVVHAAIEWHCSGLPPQP